ncbi:MAG: hypothetical protein ACNA71_09360 [Kiritimatiellia bacterium]
MRLIRMVDCCQLAACLLIMSAVSANALDLSEEKITDLYNHEHHAQLVADQLTGLDELALMFQDQQRHYLIISPPDPDFILFQSGGQQTLLDFKAFPQPFLDGLAGTTTADGLRRFPIWLYEDADSRGREIVIENIEGKEIARIPRERGYSPDWYVRERYPLLDTYSRAYRDWLLAAYDPSRVSVRYDLIVGEDDVVQYVWAQSIEAARQAEKEDTSMMLRSGWDGGAVSNFQFVAVNVMTNGAIELTIAWPESGLSTNTIDIFACTDLIAMDWEIVLTTNVNLSTNSFTWVDQDAPSHQRRFYDVWTHHDSDGDGLTDGREKRMYGTDPYNWDTDGDGVSDYDEIYVYGTDPLGTHNSLLPYVAGFETDEDYLTGPLNGQNGWESTGVVAVQDSMAFGGSQAITLEGTGASATKHFASTNSLLTTELFVFLGPQFTVPDELPASASSLISFEAGTGLQAFDGNGSGGGTWTTAPATADMLNRWVELKIEQDYTAKTWSLYVDGALKLSGLGFKDAGIYQPGALHIRSGIGGSVTCDDISVW